MKRKFDIAGCFLLFILISACTQINQHDLGREEQKIITDTLVPITAVVKMVYIPGGEYKPFYGPDTLLVKVIPFVIDERAVTNQEYLAFVTKNPQWRKSAIKPLYSDSNYLKDWPTDLQLPKNAKPNAPVCNVSWFAAKAYAKAVGKRLPTLDEWEFIAMADEITANARNKKNYSDAIIDLYLQKNRQYNEVKLSKPNYWGVYNMFDLIWEWTDDFNSILSTNDSRAGQYDDKELFCAGSATSSTDILNYAAFMRFALRTSIKAHYTIGNLGFRCAKDIAIKLN